MHTPFGLLRLITKAVLNAAGAGVLGEVFVELVPAIAQDVWENWSKATSEAQRHDETQRIAQASPTHLRQTATQLVQELAGDRPEKFRQQLVSYLTQVQATVRQTLRRPSDPTGTTVPLGFSLRSSRDVMHLLPNRPPRFQPGDQPIPGVDLELIELLGVGGFGEVWKARNPSVPNAPPVALKFCLNESTARALRHEANIDNRLLGFDAPGVVRLRHTYLTHDPPCLEYEFVEGGDLASRIAEWGAGRGGLGPQRAAQVILQLAEILAVLHRRRPAIVHRDLKPANILVQRTAGETWTFQITDFGIGGLVASQQVRETAHGISAGAHSFGSLRGSHTPLYASPEQVRGCDPDPRDDVHALGVIWYQMLTGDLDAGPPGGLDWLDELRAKGMEDRQVRVLASCFSRAARRPADAGVLAEQIQRLFFKSKSSLPQATQKVGNECPVDAILCDIEADTRVHSAAVFSEARSRTSSTRHEVEKAGKSPAPSQKPQGGSRLHTTEWPPDSLEASLTPDPSRAVGGSRIGARSNPLSVSARIVALLLFILAATGLSVVVLARWPDFVHPSAWRGQPWKAEEDPESFSYGEAMRDLETMREMADHETVTKEEGRSASPDSATTPSAKGAPSEPTPENRYRPPGTPDAANAPSQSPSEYRDARFTLPWRRPPGEAEGPSAVNCNGSP